MTLTANTDLNRFADQQIREFPVAAAAHIYRSALVGLHSVLGYLKPFEPCDLFVGVAYEECDNSAGAAAAKNCRAYVQGDFELTIASVAVTDVGRAVYATADNALAFKGHPDGFVGRVMHKFATNKAVVRLKVPGETPRQSDTGSMEFLFDGETMFNPTGAVAGPQYGGGFMLNSALGLGALNVVGGGLQLQFDAVQEIAQASIETSVQFDVTKGITFAGKLRVANIGASALIDMDWGLANVLDGTTRLNMDDATLTSHVRFHMDGASANILAESDDNVTDVAAVDTTIDNVTGTLKDFFILVRPSGLCELYIDGVRMLGTTVFAVGATETFAGFVNIEKTSDAAALGAIVIIDRLRIAGADA